MSSLHYTVGNWTVDSGETDSISTTKSLALPDLDYASDFSSNGEGKDGKTVIINTTGGTLNPIERLRYSKERVNDIYKSYDVLRSNQLPTPVGARVLAESVELIHAANSTSGAELDIPIRVWTCVESSTHNTITGDALLWALKRHIAAMFGTGSVSSEMLIQLFRGDLDPTK